MAACLATGGVASHRCAGFLWKFRKFERAAVEIMVTKGHAPDLVEGALDGALHPARQPNGGSTLPTRSWSSA
jgi:hypothetical protein